MKKTPDKLSVKPEVGANTKLVEGSNNVNLLGTWSINNQSKSTITFDSFIKYAHSNSPYCYDVNIQKFIVVYNIQKSIVAANIGHKVFFGGYWNSSIYGPSPAYLQGFPSSLDLCTYNIQDHGEYHDNVFGNGPLLGCAKMTVDVIDYNHLRLHSPSGIMYLTRESG
ncbi:MAG TPA: hypothetical protein VE971_02825 [Candidatus Eisenbacteria bacterium]|nr:hypothetical protein [Candidatus Eisenbacteria bacterium]